MRKMTKNDEKWKRNKSSTDKIVVHDGQAFLRGHQSQAHSRAPDAFDPAPGSGRQISATLFIEIDGSCDAVQPRICCWPCRQPICSGWPQPAGTSFVTRSRGIIIATIYPSRLVPEAGERGRGRGRGHMCGGKRHRSSCETPKGKDEMICWAGPMTAVAAELMPGSSPVRGSSRA